MRSFTAAMKRAGRRILAVLVAFAVVRLLFGVFAVAFLGDDQLAYSLRATAIIAAAALVTAAMAAAVVLARRFSPGNTPS